MDDKTLSQMIETLVAEEAALGARLTKVRAARAMLETLRNEEPSEFEGKLSDACRTILKASTKSFSPVEIRDQLKVIGYDLNRHKNEMAAIHGVLKRIVDSGDAETKEAKDGSGTRYRWKGQRENPSPVTAHTDVIALNAMLDTMTALQGSDVMQKMAEQLSAAHINLDQLIGLGGLAQYQDLAEKLAASTKGLEKLGLPAPKKK